MKIYKTQIQMSKCKYTITQIHKWKYTKHKYKWANANIQIHKYTNENTQKHNYTKHQHKLPNVQWNYCCVQTYFCNIYSVLMLQFSMYFKWENCVIFSGAPPNTHPDCAKNDQNNQGIEHSLPRTWFLEQIICGCRRMQKRRTKTSVQFRDIGRPCITYVSAKS